jgi:hypothetical protein
MFLLSRNRSRSIERSTSGDLDEEGKRPYAQAFIAARAELPMNGLLLGY